MAIQLRIEGGMLACPLKGEIDVGPCFDCPWVYDIVNESPNPFVECAPPLLDCCLEPTMEDQRKGRIDSKILT